MEQELLPIIITAATSIGTALTAAIVAWINYAKKRAELKEAQATAEAEKAALQKAIVDGAYIICPSCGEIIYLKEQKIHTKQF